METVNLSYEELFKKVDEQGKEIQILKANQYGSREFFFQTFFTDCYSIMLIIVFETGQIINANKSACKFYGYSFDEITSMNIMQINTLSPEEVKNEMQNAKSGDKNIFNFKHRLKNGQIKNVEVYSGKIILENKTYLYSIINDVTKKHRKDAELILAKKKAEESEFHLQERIKELEGIYSLGLLTEKHEKLNDIYTELVNRIVPESMQFSDKVFVSLEINNQIYCNIKNYNLPKDLKYLSAKINVHEKQIGKLIVTYTENLPFIEKFEQNLVDTYAERISNITERIIISKELQKQNEEYALLNKEYKTTNAELISAQKKAEENELKLRQILDAFEDTIYISNTDYEILYVNKAMERVIGSDKIGTKCYKSIYKQNQKCDWCIFDDLLKTRKLIAYDIQVPNTDQYQYVRNIIFDNNNKLTIYLDITERKLAEQALKKSEEKLKESNATKDKFFSIIAHDLRSPFSAMLGFSRILNEEFDDYDTVKQKEFIAIINNSIQNTYKLLENLLVWSRSQSGTIDFKPKETNLFLLVNETCEVLKQQAENKSINFLNQIPENIFVYADKNMLSTIIRNLVSNAIKFTPKGGIISIDAKNEQQFIKITVKDNGIGISKEIQSKIFDLGENTSTQGTENETGTGLGLILCKEFTEKHGGKIWVESEIDKGSLFCFTIPYKSEKLQ